MTPFIIIGVGIISIFIATLLTSAKPKEGNSGGGKQFFIVLVIFAFFFLGNDPEKTKDFISEKINKVSITTK